MAMSAEYRSNFVAFTGNGDVSKWVKNSLVGRKTPNKQTDLSFMFFLPQTFKMIDQFCIFKEI